MRVYEIYTVYHDEIIIEAIDMIQAIGLFDALPNKKKSDILSIFDKEHHDLIC